MVRYWIWIAKQMIFYAAISCEFQVEMFSIYLPCRYVTIVYLFLLFFLHILSFSCHPIYSYIDRRDANFDLVFVPVTHWNSNSICVKSILDFPIITWAIANASTCYPGHMSRCRQTSRWRIHMNHRRLDGIVWHSLNLFFFTRIYSTVDYRFRRISVNTIISIFVVRTNVHSLWA